MTAIALLGAGVATVFVVAAGVVVGGWLVIRLSAAIVSRIPEDADQG